MKTKRMTQFEDKLSEMIKSHKEYLNVFVTEYDNLKPTVQDYIQGLYVTKLLCNTVCIRSGYDTAYARFVLKYGLEKMTQFVYIAQKSTSYRVYLAQLEEMGALAHLVGTTEMKLVCSVLQGDRLQQEYKSFTNKGKEREVLL